MPRHMHLRGNKSFIWTHASPYGLNRIESITLVSGIIPNRKQHPAPISEQPEEEKTKQKKRVCHLDDF